MGAGASALPTQQAFVLTGAGGTSTSFQNAIETYTTTLSYSNAAFIVASNCAQVTLLSGVDAAWRFESVLMQETTQFTYGTITNLYGSVGTSSTYANLVPLFLLGVAGGQNHWYESAPDPPVLNTGSTYNIAAQLCAQSGGNLGNGSSTYLTAGALYFELRGSKVVH